MQHYQKSNYAINKCKKGIVYRFQDGSSLEIDLESFLNENPDKTANDFELLKELSDQIYYEQVLEETRYRRKTTSIGKLEETNQLATRPLHVDFEEKEDMLHMFQATEELFKSGLLTDIQKRRFAMHFVDCLSYREIARSEQVYFTSVRDSIELAVRKIKRILENY